MPFTVGIDIGTSSTKAVVVENTGKVVYTVSHEYDFATPQALWAESDPKDWWAATQACLRDIAANVDAGDIVGLGLTGQMHGLVLLDDSGNVLRPCIMWNDQRTSAECEELTDQLGLEKILEVTGNPILTGFTAPKILWVQKHEPEVWQKVSKILLPKDYIRYMLTGVFATDVSDASGTSLLDVGARDWSSLMMEACGVSADMLPQVYESPEVTSKLTNTVSESAGLPKDLIVVAGGGDQAAGAVGSGVVLEGMVSASLGTSGVVFAPANTFKPEPEGRLHAFCAAVPGKWHYMGVQLSCAGSYQWFADELGFGSNFKELDGEASQVQAGSEGLFFLPYLSGERMPHADPYSRAGFIGLTLRHKRGHMARAVLEGVTFGLKEGLLMMNQLGISTDKIIVSGGGAASPLWKQLMADIFDSRIVNVNATEGGALGAAILAMVGAGLYADVVAACEATIQETAEVTPGVDREVYPKLLNTYSNLYPALKSIFPNMN